MPIAAAVALRRAMNAERLPDTQTASVSARLSAEGSRSASSRSRSVRTSPARTRRFDPPAASACRYRVTSALVMVIDGPLAEGLSGCAVRTTSAVMALATEPIGRTAVAPRVAIIPLRLVASAKLPLAGVGIGGGAAPSSRTVAGAWMLTVAGGGAAASFTATNVAAVTTIAAITATNTIHTHDVRRETAIRPVYARRPVACLRAYQRRRRVRDGVTSRDLKDQALARRETRAPLTALESEVLAENRTTRRAGTLTASPVRGLRPRRAARCAVLKLPNPWIRTSSPFSNDCAIVSKNQRTSSRAAVTVISARSASAFASTSRVTTVAMRSLQESDGETGASVRKSEVLSQHRSCRSLC